MPFSSRLPVLLLTVLLLTGCAASAGPTDDGTAGSTAEPTATAPASTTSRDAPQRIVSLSPSSTEILFAIGAGDRVAAVDTYSNHPEEAPQTQMSGFDPNVEALADLDPDLVVVSGDRNDVVAGMEAIGVPVLVHPSAEDLDDVWSQVRALGEATGHVDQAEALVERMQDGIDQVVADTPDAAEGLTYFHEVSDGYYTATSSTFVGRLYGLLGLVNVADDADGAAEAGGYPQLSAEFVVEQDPDLVFIAGTREGATPVEERPGWDTLSAVEHDAVTHLDPDVASRWGPRIVDQLEAARTAVEELLATTDDS